MTDRGLTPELLALIAERFKALGEPARLQLLQVLRGGERTVSDLIRETGLSQANVSKHLRLLRSLRFVERRIEGLHAHYRLADESVFQLCDIVCGRLTADMETRRRLLGQL